jgi:PP-loop superfamily ATP-utilizing enzyme
VAKNAGYPYVALDLEGYRTGAMNEVLPGAKSR